MLHMLQLFQGRRPVWALCPRERGQQVVTGREGMCSSHRGAHSIATIERQGAKQHNVKTVVCCAASKAPPSEVWAQHFHCRCFLRFSCIDCCVFMETCCPVKFGMRVLGNLRWAWYCSVITAQYCTMQCAGLPAKTSCFAQLCRSTLLVGRPVCAQK